MRVGVVGLGKMGLSHLSMIRAHPDVEVAAVADAAGYALDVLHKYTGLATFANYADMLDQAQLDAVIIATPTRIHASMAEAALEHGVNVFCEKPLCLSASDSGRIAQLADERGLVTQVGYHNRFVGAFREVRELLDSGAIGEVTHVLAEAYGPVVLRPKGSTWRSRKSEGGGCLYDYAAHPVDLLTWYLGEPTGVGGVVLNRVFSEQTEDQVFGTLLFGSGVSAQLSVDWSDESRRKMTTQMTLWGTGGHIHADRQECRVYLRRAHGLPAGYDHGWNVKYTTELTDAAWFYLRGEEYSTQLDYFVQRVRAGKVEGLNSFASAAATDRALELLASGAPPESVTRTAGEPPPAIHLRNRPTRKFLRRRA